MKKILTTLIALACVLPLGTRADSVHIKNEVNSSASSGSGGESRVKIYTEVNGEVIENFERAFGGASVETKVEINTQGAENLVANSPTTEEELRTWLEELKKFLNYVLEQLKNIQS